MTSTLQIKNLVAAVEGKTVLKGISLEVPRGEIHAIMGPNGSGKTTLSQVIMGHPKYHVVSGEILFKGQNILTLTPDKRSQLGLFLAFQYPREIPGVKLVTFLRAIHHARQQQVNPGAKKLTPMAFQKLLETQLDELSIDRTFLERYLNTGFSGGEKKKAEMLQLSLLQPDIAVLDETDSGLDVDALRVVCSSVNKLKAKTDLGVLMITHYNRILDYIIPDQVHVMIDGVIVRSGGKDFAKEVETKGYSWLTTPQTPLLKGVGAKSSLALEGEGQEGRVL